MRNDNDKKTSLILSACGVVPVVWLALLTAPYVGGGIVEIIQGLTDAMGSPFAITVCEDSVKTVLIFLAAFAKYLLFVIVISISVSRGTP